ncbi:MAG TPA: alkyl sulfatase dimerization domain-containing protein [Acidimicrobiales bacterium]|nr:alkyl sulfatase dimerization domain-containing protein [Acidimicrobiales bacterium]
MSEGVLETADRLWRGEVDIAEPGLFFSETSLTEVADGVSFVRSFANVTAFATGDGLVLVDTGSPFSATAIHENVRAWSSDRLHTAIYSHGHIDHVFGVGPFEDDARSSGWPSPNVVSHDALPRRFDRYLLTAGYNAVINQRQFQAPDLAWPTRYRYPDHTYRDEMSLEVGGVLFELHHDRGETDDHTWTWVPEPRVLCCGDFFIWASPNAGNPQKVQRYPSEWAAALRKMAALGPEVLLPGHGFPVVGAERVSRALTDTAELLESLHDQTVALMNRGARLDEVVHGVQAPRHLLERPYLHAIYDEPEFVVHNIWRLYGGWYDGDPSHLKPAPAADLARELAALAGGAGRLAARARQLAEAGELRLAAHLAETAAQAAPEDPEVHRTRTEVFERLVADEASIMSRGIFAWAASESRHRAQG